MSDDLVERVVDAMLRARVSGGGVEHEAHAAISIALEEAARVCDAQAMEQADKRDEVPEDSEDWQVYNQAAFISAENAAAIRAMIKG